MGGEPLAIVCMRIAVARTASGTGSPPKPTAPSPLAHASAKSVIPRRSVPSRSFVVRRARRAVALVGREVQSVGESVACRK